MAAEKRAKKTVSKLPLKRETAIVSIVLIIAVALAFMFYSASKSGEQALAEVNGIMITQDDLNDIELTIPPQLRANVTGSDLLEQAINFEIVKQESRKIGITITDEEVDASIDSSLELAGLTRGELKQSLRQQNIEWDRLFSAYKKQLLSYRFMNETILKNITVTEDEMREFYDAYSEEISLPYNEVRQQINQTLLVAKSQQELNEWLAQKRMEYNIVRHSQ